MRRRYDANLGTGRVLPANQHQAEDLSRSSKRPSHDGAAELHRRDDVYGHLP
jgi:hypothetical protein